MASIQSDGRYNPLKDESEQNSWRLTLPLFLKYVALFSVLALHYLAQGFQTYVSTEWSQHKIKLELFPNASLHRVSPCADTNHSSPEYIRYAHVQQEAARWQMYNTLASTVPAILTTLLYPSYTDSYGRRFLFILSLAGQLVMMVITSLVVGTNGRLEFLVVANFVSGITGTAYCLLSSTYSYVADITPAGKKRSFVLSLEDAIIQIFMTISALAAGYFIQFRGFLPPVITASALSLVAVLVAVFLLPESLEPSQRTKPPSVLSNLKRPLEFYTTQEFKGQRTSYLLLMFSYVFVDVSNVHRTKLEALYQLGMPFCWTPSKIGIFTTARKGGQGFIGVFIIVALQLCLTDIGIVVLSITLNIGSYIMEALASVDWLLFLVTVPAVFEFLACPLLRSLMSGMTPKEKQGALFASICVIQNLCALLAGIGDNTIYSATMFILNGFVFLVLASVSALALILLGIFTYRKRTMTVGGTVEDISASVVNDGDASAT